MITTLERVRSIIHVDVSDEHILALIPLVEQEYERLRNRPFDTDDDGEVVYPQGAELTAALMVGYHLAALSHASGFLSESLGDYSYTRSAVEYPPQVIGGIRRYVGVK